MAATIMDGRAVAVRVRAAVARALELLDREVALATVLVGDDPASAAYVRAKQKACAEAGMGSIDHKLGAETTEDELLGLIGELNADERVNGILVQLPLPAQIDEARVISAIAPIKDVDGFHPLNSGFLLRGQPTLVPATPAGVMALLDAYGVEPEGARAVVIGRSNIVGKPLSLLLLAANATVTVCHTRTRELAAVAAQADILVAAVGRARTVTTAMVKPGAVVVDVGISRGESGLVGDVAHEVRDVAGFLTPVPGGVGPMTIAMLLENTVRAARYQAGELVFPSA